MGQDFNVTMDHYAKAMTVADRAVGDAMGDHIFGVVPTADPVGS
jgi:hypothetical protein